MISVILCAAGNGSRANLGDNKIFHDLNGMPVLSYSLSAFAPFADEMLIACRAEDEARINALLSPYPNAKTVLGGNTRAESIYHALKCTHADMVLVHDAARPFVTSKIIGDCIASIKEHGSGICALPATDTTVLAQDGKIVSVPVRKDVYTVQTPQGFYTERLRAAYEAAEARLAEFTDDSGVYAAYIEPPRLFTGDPCNRKLTYAEDFLPAVRVGFGVDTHAFAQGSPLTGGSCHKVTEGGNYITLGGVQIPSERGLIAHSDGDVLIHALMDALLSAIGERDIGYHFPDTDPAYKDADSMQLLARVMDMVRAKSLKVANVSVSVLAERPRLSPYIEAMRENLRATLDCENIAIAAGTNEKLGYVGEGKGITVYATVLLNDQR